MKHEYLLVNMTKGWIQGLHDGQHGLFSARLERRLLGVKHDLPTLGQLNQSRRERERKVHTTVVQKPAVSRISPEIVSSIAYHGSTAHPFPRVEMMAALAMTCLQLYSTAAPLLSSAVDEASRWAGDNLVIIAPRSTLDDMPENVSQWCQSSQPLFLAEDIPEQMDDTLHLLSRMRHLLGHKDLVYAPADMVEHVRTSLIFGSACKLSYSPLRPGGTLNPQPCSRDGNRWLAVVSTSPGQAGSSGGNDLFLCNATTGHFLRRSLFEHKFLSRARSRTLASMLRLGDVLALVIITCLKQRWDWAGHSFVLTSDMSRVAAGKDESSAFMDFLDDLRACDMQGDPKISQPEASYACSKLADEPGDGADRPAVHYDVKNQVLALAPESARLL